MWFQAAIELLYDPDLLLGVEPLPTVTELVDLDAARQKYDAVVEEWEVSDPT